MMQVKTPIKQVLSFGGLFRHMANMRPSCQSRTFPWADRIICPLVQYLPDTSPLSPPPPLHLGSSVAPTTFSPGNVSNLNNCFHSLGTAQKRGLFSQKSKKVPFPLGFSVKFMGNKSQLSGQILWLCSFPYPRARVGDVGAVCLLLR